MAKGKKGRSASNDVDSGCSTPSESETQSHDVRCPHVGKGIHLPALKKSLKTSWTRIGQCGPCLKEQRSRNTAVNNGGGDPDKSKGAKSKDCLLAPHSKPVDPKVPVTIWMCLRCGLQLCDSNSTGKHFAKHMDVPRSDIHCVALNLMTWKLYCHECKAEVLVDSYKKSREALDFVKRIEDTKGRSSQFKEPSNKSQMAKSVSVTSNVSVTSSNQSDITIPRARGLSNLGNTCFFNAVMQCLSQTHPLTHLLDQHSQKGASFHVPSVQVPAVPYSKSAEKLEPLSLQLAEAAPITLALAAFMKEMNSIGRHGVVNPGHLFGQVCRKSPQFRGFHQQDAHELLRHLMEGLRTEEVKRQKCAILRHFNLSEKTDPASVPGPTRRKLQAIGRHSNYTLVDKIFGGHLVSTIVCEQCHNSSQIYEPFLDISLPLIEEKPQRPNNKKTRQVSSGEDEDVSCFGSRKKSNEESTKSMSKKEKMRNKREKRRAKKENRKRNRKISEEENDDKMADAAKEVSDKENLEDNAVESQQENGEIQEEDNLEEQKSEEEGKIKNSGEELEDQSVEKKAEKNENVIKEVDGNEEDDEDDGFSEEDCPGWEWDYGEDKKDDSPVKNGSDYLEVDPSESEESKQSEKRPLCSLNPLPKELYEQSSPTESSTGLHLQVDGEVDSEDPETGASSNGDIEDNVDESNTLVNGESFAAEPFQPKPDHLDVHMEQLCRKVRKMSVASVSVSQETYCNNDFEEKNGQKQQEYLLSEEEEEGEENKSNAATAMATENHVDAANKEQLRLPYDWIARSLTSIAPRYHSKSGECSVYSCLTQFTAPELLTGQNKWACSRCTSMHAAKKKRDYEDAEENEIGDEPKKKKKEEVIYSNASKQLLIYSPPAILTIHLKRFQQTLYNLRKVNRHVDFPSQLDLAPFCSSTSISTSSVRAGTSEILYELFGVVEHSGRLQGGHYTAYVKLRTSNAYDHLNYADFFTSPTVKTEEIDQLIEEINRKMYELKKISEEVNGNSDYAGGGSLPSKWYHISDTHVSEVSEEKALKSQAYLLFYERIN